MGADRALLTAAACFKFDRHTWSVLEEAVNVPLPFCKSISEKALCWMLIALQRLCQNSSLDDVLVHNPSLECSFNPFDLNISTFPCAFLCVACNSCQRCGLCTIITAVPGWVGLLRAVVQVLGLHFSFLILLLSLSI